RDEQEAELLLHKFSGERILKHIHLDRVPTGKEIAAIDVLIELILGGNFCCGKLARVEHGHRQDQHASEPHEAGDHSQVVFPSTEHVTANQLIAHTVLDHEEKKFDDHRNSQKNENIGKEHTGGGHLRKHLSDRLVKEGASA